MSSSRRVLLLADDAALIERQLGGEDIAWSSSLALRDDISTDEITPAYICYYFDATLGDFTYLGLRAGQVFPITPGSVRRGKFVASVAGRRRGKGSSREQSPYAERAAGIRVVLAESFERIYRENCQNLGLLTSTDFSLIPKLQAGDPIPLSAFTDGEGPIARGIIELGGLYPYNVARLAGTVTVPVPDQTPRPLTAVEKILARHWVADAPTGRVGVGTVRPGDQGFVRTDLRFSHEYVTPMAAMMFEELVGPDASIVDPDSVLFFRDHLTFLADAMAPAHRDAGLLDVAMALEAKQRTFAEAKGITLYGEVARGGSVAICHSKILEDHALPGQVVVGSDSHTPHAGAIGCVAFGIGTTAVCNAWITRDVRVEVPPTCRIVVRGTPPVNVTAKDVMLEILRQPFVASGGAIGMALEYAGDAVAAWSIDERATLTNMAAEVGALTAIVPPDARTIDFLIERRGLAPATARSLTAGLAPDHGAEYAHIIEIDATALRPMVALPGDPGNGLPIDGLGHVAIDIAYAGSCTAGKRDDMDMYARVFTAARETGRAVAEGVRCYVQCGSTDVFDYCVEQGYDQLFADVGATLIAPSCGACINAGPGVSRRADEVTVSAINRNFPGRSGPGQLYLASPYTVAASALAGHIVAWDPVLTEDSQLFQKNFSSL
ncbi:MAG TPA: aconitase family protein [Gemmatimonadaceae bacterium]|nr:aconitase family protein [Gemmatimonadaceae bacterium]